MLGDRDVSAGFTFLRKQDRDVSLARGRGLLSVEMTTTQPSRHFQTGPEIMTPTPGPASEDAGSWEGEESSPRGDTP